MHGVPRLIRAKSTTARLFWMFVCLVAMSFFCVELAQLLRKYYSFPKKVTIEVLPLVVPFPAISLCNMRNLDTIVLNKLNRVFKEASNPLEWSDYTNDTFINAYMSVVSKYYPMFQMRHIDLKVFQTVLTRTSIATNIERSLVTRAGVPFKEFIVTCRYGGHECDRERNFRQFFDSYYYNCFTFAPPEPEEPNSLLAEGLENGWTATVLSGSGMLDKNEEIRLIPGTHERFSPMSGTEGVRVVIHPPDTEPFPHTEGFDVPPGHAVTFGVRARKNVRIGAPHGNCSNENPFGTEDHFDYRLMSCQKKCVQRSIVAQCGCKDITLPGHDAYPHVLFCSSDIDISPHCAYNATEDCVRALYRVYDRFMCARNTTAKMSGNATASQLCGCFPPCREVSYDITYSLSKWPAESFDGEEAYVDIFRTERYPERFDGPEDREKYDLYGEFFDAPNRRVAMRNFARLNVYVADSNVLKTEETADYTESQLLSDIGGQLGLWVGISVITLAEVLELFLDVFKYFFLRHGPYRCVSPSV